MSLEVFHINHKFCHQTGIHWTYYKNNIYIIFLHTGTYNFLLLQEQYTGSITSIIDVCFFMKYANNVEDTYH